MSAFDINVKVTVEAPALVDAVNRLCDRFTPIQTTPATIPAAPIQEALQAPATPAETPSQQTVTESPTTAPATAEAVPAPAKVIDLETISRAGAALIDQGKLPQVLAVLKEFGVEAITQLQPSTYPAFAERLKALGAVI